MDLPQGPLAEHFAAHPEPLRERLLALRRMVIECAAATPGVGRIEESLKWGQPSFLTTESGSGTTVRIDADREGGVAIFVNCRTDLVETFRAHYPDAFVYEGSRGLHVPAGAPLPEAAIRHCLALALTYHARKKQRRPNQAGGS